MWKRLKEFGYSHLGIMDMDNLYGAYHFLEETKVAGIQGLLGLDLNLVKDGQPLSLRLVGDKQPRLSEFDEGFNSSSCLIKKSGQIFSI